MRNQNTEVMYVTFMCGLVGVMFVSKASVRSCVVVDISCI